MKPLHHIICISKCCILLLITFFYSLISSCNKHKQKITNLNDGKIISLGHGGMGMKSKYPMNSLESIKKCLSLGSNGSEFDVQLTKDSVLVAFHNEKLNENTNKNGFVNSMNWEDLKNTDYCKKRFKNYSLVSINEIFDNIPNYKQIYFSFDCKLYPDEDNRNLYVHQFANAIIKIIDKYESHSTCFIETQSAELIELLQKKSSKKLKLFYLTHDYNSGFEVAKRLNCFGISISTDKINNNQIEEAHANNLYIALWDVRTQSDNKSAIKKNPDVIQSDEIKDLVKELN